jgi:riboflavin synthase
MFTGIVEGARQVVAREGSPAGVALRIALADLAAGVPLGASIAIDGCCLTVTANDGGIAAFDVAPETLARTTLGDLAPGDLVHVERSLRLGDRVDGHLVTGHVDGVAILEAVETRGIERDLFVTLPPRFRRLVVEKGSLALAGVSLTVAEITATGVRVMIIPHTAEVTTLSRQVVGSRLNFEVDPIGKWVERWLEPWLAARSETGLEPGPPRAGGMSAR